ncbi:hypothetical protein GY45DRAFT_347649 [Cubamyces sp. BRFM 1775]|nr:hypothetical protein GY45DRAFT_347649 [Cubamyces sp. BRFM 1775]
MSDVPVPGLQYIDDSQLSWTGIAGLPHLAPPLLPDVSDELNALPVYGEDYTPVTAPYWQLEYAFTGNYVSVVGVTFPWVEGVPASAVCSVDNQFQQTYMAPQATQASVNVSYYTLTAHQLTDGQHTLHINVTLASSLNPFVLDYLVVGTDPDSTVPTSSSTSSGTGTTALQSSTASTNNTSTC